MAEKEDSTARKKVGELPGFIYWGNRDIDEEDARKILKLYEQDKREIFEKHRKKGPEYKS